jgi:hypothetical protein
MDLALVGPDDLRSDVARASATGGSRANGERCQQSGGSLLSNGIDRSPRLRGDARELGCELGQNV